MRKQGMAKLFLSMISILILAACSSGGGSGTSSSGDVSVGLTDATTDAYQAVYITVKEVRVSMAAEGTEGEEEWLVVAEPHITCNLLELVNGVIQHLGLSSLEPGEYQQLRLVLDGMPDGGINIKGEAHPYANYIIGDVAPDSYEYLELDVPSGYQTGFKIVGGFTVEAEETTSLVLDFNVLKSIIQAGTSGKWLMNPTVKALVEEGSASIVGSVFTTNDDGDVPVEGAIVSAQPITESAEEETAPASSTITDSTGGYSMLVPAGTYNVIAIVAGFQTEVAEVVVPGTGEVQQDFFMIPVEGTGTIYGNVNILNAAADQFVTINIFSTQDDGTRVEVASKSVANGGDYWFDLPVGVYSMTAIFAVDGEDMTLEANEAFEILAGSTIKFDILFDNNDDDGSSDADQPKKVTICHKGHEITISSSALKAHLNHGDTEGACEDADDGDDGSDDSADDGDNDDTSEDTSGKVTICHKGRQITVSSSALKAHMKHGDVEGTCEDADDGDDGSDDSVDDGDSDDGDADDGDADDGDADDGESEDAGEDTATKVTICHKGKTISISESTLQAHLNHGDSEGACDAE